MKIATDLHCHTIASTHAYSTVWELAKIAGEKGMDAIAVTDHGMALPDSPHPWHFENLKTIPREMEGVKILYGCEANITSITGAIDMPDYLLKRMDIVVASIHRPCYDANGDPDHTSAYLGALENPYVDILGHSGNPQYPYQHEEVLLKAKQLHKLIEINAHSFEARPQNIAICREIALRCKELEVGICVDSDAHICFQVGEYSPALEMLSEIGFPYELIMNRDLKTLKAYFASRKEIFA